MPKAYVQAMQITTICLANQEHVALSTYCLLDAVLHVNQCTVAALLSKDMQPHSRAMQCMQPIVHCLFINLHPLLTQYVESATPVLTKLQIGQASGVCVCHQMATDR